MDIEVSNGVVDKLQKLGCWDFGPQMETYRRWILVEQHGYRDLVNLDKSDTLRRLQCSYSVQNSLTSHAIALCVLRQLLCGRSCL